MNESILRKSGILALVLLALSAPSLASFQGLAEEPVRISVSYADLDLDKDAGVEMLYGRLKYAAGRACGPTTLRGAGSVQQLVDNKTCYRNLLDRAVRTADNAALTKRHSG